MNEQTVKIVFQLLIGASVLNFAIAVIARAKTKNKQFNGLILYWPSVILTFLVAGILRHTPTEMGFSYFFQGISSNLMVQIMCQSLNLKPNWRFHLSLQTLCMGISAYLLTQTNIGFTPSLLPVSIAFCIPFIRPIWYALVSHKDQTNWVEKSLGVVFITAVIHHLNFVFFRLVPGTEAMGFSITIAEYQCMSVFLPLLINHRQEEKEQKNLQQVVEKISGKNPFGIKTDDLYAQLEFQISQKELIYNELQKTNSNLEEEREMNEILIRTISHDLANPLTVIGAYIEMLHSGKVKEEDSEKIWNRLKSNTQSALDMIGRIRNAILTRTQASLVAVQDVSVDICMKRVLELFETRLKEKNLKVVYKNKVDPSTLIKAEENALTEHIFANVLSNAIKFSYPGSDIHIVVTSQDEHIKVEIKDQGTGIQDTRLEKRLLMSTEGTNGETGTGFGLMVMGYFLRQFGATIEMASKTDGPQRGTAVAIKLKKSQSDYTSIFGPTSAEANFTS